MIDLDIISILNLNITVGCAFPMVISSDFHMGKYRDDNHEEDAPYFILPFILLDLTSESCDLEMHFLMFLSSKLSQTKFHGLHRYGKRPRVSGALIFIPLSGVHRMISSSFKHLFVNKNTYASIMLQIGLGHSLHPFGQFF